MLLYIILQIPILVISALTQFFPTVTVLPFNIDVYLQQGINYLYFIVVIIPPLATMYSAFLWLLGWKISLRIFKMIPFIGRMV